MPSLKPTTFGIDATSTAVSGVNRALLRWYTITGSSVAPATSATNRTRPAAGFVTRYGGSNRMPLAPARSAACTNCLDDATEPPAPANTGTLPAVASTATATTRSNSPSSNAWNSPVPQATNTAPGPAETPCLTCSASTSKAMLPSVSNGVTGKNSTPSSCIPDTHPLIAPVVIPRRKDFCSDRYTMRLGTSASNAPASTMPVPTMSSDLSMSSATVSV